MCHSVVPACRNTAYLEVGCTPVMVPVKQLGSECLQDQGRNYRLEEGGWIKWRSPQCWGGHLQPSSGVCAPHEPQSDPAGQHSPPCKHLPQTTTRAEVRENIPQPGNKLVPDSEEELLPQTISTLSRALSETTPPHTPFIHTPFSLIHTHIYIIYIIYYHWYDVWSVCCCLHIFICTLWIILRYYKSFLLIVLQYI